MVKLLGLLYFFINKNLIINLCSLLILIYQEINVTSLPLSFAAYIFFFIYYLHAETNLVYD